MLIITESFSSQRYYNLVMFYKQVYDLLSGDYSKNPFSLLGGDGARRSNQETAHYLQDLFPSNKLFLDLSHVVLQIVFTTRIKSSDDK